MRKYLFIIPLILLIIDTGYSFIQHLNIVLDGDMADIILPSESCKQVFGDPLGLRALLFQEVYVAPNRFFALWITSVFFKTVPFIVQNFFNPVDSIYITCAIAKTATQLLLITVLSSYISRNRKIFSNEFLLSAVIVTPFFFNYQYWKFGIIPWSISFTFSYALPLGLLFLYFLPFFRIIFYEEKIKFGILYKIYLVILAIVISLNGPIVPATAIIICSLFLFVLIYKQFKQTRTLSFYVRLKNSIKNIPGEIIFFISFLLFTSAYSMYIGLFNIENTTIEMTLLDRYLILPGGIFELFKNMYLIIPLIFFIILNYILIRLYFNEAFGKKILSLLKWIALCSLIYILLLPFGGVRTYRMTIVRFDTIMPVTLSLLMFFGLSSCFLLFNLKNKFKIVYSTVLILFLMFYIYEDKPTTGINKCERNSLYIISESKDSVVLIPSQCNVMSWTKILKYQDSDLNTELLKYWGVTKVKKYYYQK